MFHNRPADDGFDYLRHPIPTIMKLEGEDNFLKWRETVRKWFDEFGLTRFIDNTDIIPAADATRKELFQYLWERSMAYQLLRNSVGPVMDILFAHGWKDEEDKPQLLYDTVNEAIWVNEETWCDIAFDLMPLNAANFDTLQAFLEHYSNCVAKLQDIGIEYQDRAKLAIIPKALKPHVEFWENTPARSTQLPPTYDVFLRYLMARAREELNMARARETMFNMLAITNPKQVGEQPKKPANRSQGSNNTDIAGGVDCGDPACSTVHLTMPKHPYHAYCQQHHGGGMDACWVAHPELRRASGRRRGNQGNQVSPGILDHLGF